LSPAVRQPFLEQPAIGIWQSGIWSSKGHYGVFAARKFLHADLGSGLKLIAHGQAGVVSQLRGGSDIGIIVTDADPQSFRGEQIVLCGECEQFLPGCSTFLVWPDVPYKSNSQWLAFLES